MEEQGVFKLDTLIKMKVSRDREDECILDQGCSSGLSVIHRERA